MNTMGTFNRIAIKISENTKMIKPKESLLSAHHHSKNDPALVKRDCMALTNGGALPSCWPATLNMTYKEIP